MSPWDWELSEETRDSKDGPGAAEAEDPQPTPTSFPEFPYPTPYSIQTEFMRQLYQCIDQRKVGIFESPTGTGKSLSMICGAVTWLMDRERAERERAKKEQAEEAQSKSSNTANLKGATAQVKRTDDTPDWVQQHRAISDAAIERQEREVKRVELEVRVQKIREREKKVRESIARKMKRQAAGIHSIGGQGGPRSAAGQPKKKKGHDSDEDKLDDIEFLVDEYDSDDNSRGGRKSKAGGNAEYGNVSKEVLELMKRFDDKEAAYGAKRTGFGSEDADEEPDVLKIYYCSRTHSQLSQFIDELRKTSFGEHLHVVSLGSRKSLCINDRFRQKASVKNSSIAEPVVNVNKLSDACLDAQKSGTPSDQRCEFLHMPSSTFGKNRSGLDYDDGPSSGSLGWWSRNDTAMDGDEKLLEFRDHTLARVRDIEELAELGTELETCPYYGSRQTVRHCQLITLPYNLLLHASTRESLKLMIKNNILLLDEAHNLINSLLQMHSVSISLEQVVLAQSQLQVYLSRYEKRLSSTNEGYIRVLIRILKCLEGFVEKWKAGPSSSPSNSSPTERRTAPIAGQLSISQQQRQQQQRSVRPANRVLKVNEFLHEAGMDHINLFKAHTYLETSGVARKLQGLHESLQRQEVLRMAKEQERATQNASGNVKIHQGRTVNGIKRAAFLSTGFNTTKSTTTPILLTVDAFLMSLLNADNDGRVIVTMEDEGLSNTDGDEDDEKFGLSGSTASEPTRTLNTKPMLKFMLLNPANVFKPLVDEARSVVLTGGTMEPVSDLLSHLFPYLKSIDSITGSNLVAAPSPVSYPRVHRFSCGHVIPKKNLMTLVMEKTPTGSSLELNFANRNQEQVMDGIGQSLVNLLNMIPDGVVVFFVSYSYMGQVLSRWKTKPASGSSSATVTATSIMERIQTRKRVFIEPREAAEADRMLKEYQDCIRANPEHQPASGPGPRGAVLFSVVGGKMSEGINFSDRLGRGVIMIGMPFPNKGSSELQERMRYMDEVQQQELQQQQRNPMPTPMRMTAGSEYYENLCMRAVNQSIGRAIRHQGDHAVIILMDRRYGVPRIRKKLPGWIGSSIEVCEQFGPVMTKLSGFFRAKRGPLK
ncbi:DEAD H (Asp-Glu-Ala-Asp His) box helicase 11 [Mortierella polycephala]|uniref:ATP-dependent DNA helicase CHL1 n=1 Tax=Mortierella polycephala TaxID=41804 RepID=A0A9P6Q071_9FUNG|nr:DEAD H (Asp-Glu-Ala-Asp His) box helicase 11 [Mortierella polycephala]